MFKSPFSLFRPMVALFLGFAVSQAVLGSYAIPITHVGQGQVQIVNYGVSTITVHGHAYKVSPKATYIGGGVKNIGGLRPGMKVRFVANAPLTDPKMMITHIIVLPSTSH